MSLAFSSSSRSCCSFCSGRPSGGGSRTIAEPSSTRFFVFGFGVGSLPIVLVLFRRKEQTSSVWCMQLITHFAPLGECQLPYFGHGCSPHQRGYSAFASNAAIMNA